MSESNSRTARRKTALVPDRRESPDRAARTWTERMTVRHLGGGRDAVDSRSGAESCTDRGFDCPAVRRLDMDVHYLQHVPYEPPAAIGDWARERGHDLTGTHLYEDDHLPTPDDYDLLVVMGGPMGVGDTDEYPWLAPERELIAETLDAEVPVLGVCLGAQQVAAALGADVYAHEEREVGWFPVETTDAATHSPLAPLAPGFPAFHWHGDTFDVPDGGTLLATTSVCRNQAFSAANGLALGLQFHLEATRESVGALVDAVDGETGSGEFVQDAEELLAEDAPFDELRGALDAALDSFVAGVAASRAE
jgi:GMP synthase-like glutamine amidotransferase